MERIREMIARTFYPGDVKKLIDEFLEKIKTPEKIQEPLAGIVPHAGWIYSGRVAARVFFAFKEKAPQISKFILFGSAHHWGVTKCGIYPEGKWKTPIGNLEIDKELVQKIYEKNKKLFELSFSAHENEHSIEVQAPFIKYFFPDSKIIPITVPADKNAVETGVEVAKVILENKKENIAVIGTTDLTHYGPHYEFSPAGSGAEAFKWMKDNDKRIINIALAVEADRIIEEAKKNHNACGAGAMAAVVAYAKQMGKKNGILLEYTTSEDEAPSSYFTYAVGYAGIIF